MLNKKHITLFVILYTMGYTPANAQDDMSLSTLFTTPQERQIINSNRYKQEKKQLVKRQESTETVAVRELLQEKVTRSYKVSGISINMDGSNTAWVNNKAYENGAKLEDGSKLRINKGTIKSVSIITPDGKQHTATPGETLAVTYMRALEE